MVIEKNIRKIPQYMLDKIKEIDEKTYPKPNGNTRFYTYYTKFKNELCSVTVAVRNKYKKWYCKQVVVHGLHNDKVLLRDIGQTMGFIKVGWYREGLSKYSTWVDYDWGWNKDKYFQMTTATIINKNYILSLPEYKYSAIDLYSHGDIFNYLRYYEKYPQCELLVKAGLSRYATSKQILEKCKKDKNFCKWLYKNKDIIKEKYYFVVALLQSYKNNKPLSDIQRILNFKKEFSVKGNFTHLKEVFKKDIHKLLEYLSKQDTDGYCYTDYLYACEYLGLDMNEEKNRFPHDFKRWHDIRIDQYRTAKAIKDEEQRKELYKNFEKVANKYISLQRKLKDNYVCIIAKSPAELINEGQLLHHCVGSMNYEQKFAREESLIFFVRLKENVDNPLVTVEYSISKKQVLQCYGERDTKPSDEILEFVNKKWLPYANRKMKAIV